MLTSDIAVKVFTNALDRRGLSYDRIGVEVTEDVLLDRNSREICETLNALRAFGAKVSFDDFGTGYASLSHLRTFPFDELKIDRSFINNMPDGLMSGEIIRSLTMLGQKAGKTVIAEGIETQAQSDLLIEHGCQIGQGYLFSPPIPFPQATEFMRSTLMPGPAVGTIVNNTERKSPDTISTEPK